MKLKNVPKKPQTVSRTLLQTKSQAELTDQYIEYVKQTAGDDVIVNELLSAVIEQFIQTDRDFKKYLKSLSEKPQPTSNVQSIEQAAV